MTDSVPHRLIISVPAKDWSYTPYLWAEQNCQAEYKFSHFTAYGGANIIIVAHFAKEHDAALFALRWG